MAKQLNLTDAEKAKVKALFESQDANRQKKQAEMKKTREEMKAKFEAERKSQDAELQKIIGAEKFQKFQATRAERFEKMKHRGEHAPEHAPEPPVAKKEITCNYKKNPVDKLIDGIFL